MVLFDEIIRVLTRSHFDSAGKFAGLHHLPHCAMRRRIGVEGELGITKCLHQKRSGQHLESEPGLNTHNALQINAVRHNESLTVTLDAGQFRKYDYLDIAICGHRVRNQTPHHSLK